MTQGFAAHPARGRRAPAGSARARCTSTSIPRKRCSARWCARKSCSVLAAGRGVRPHAKGDTRANCSAPHPAHLGTMGDPSMARIVRLVHGELHKFPELARFYFDEVILRGARADPVGAGPGRRQRRVPAGPHRFAARALPSLVVFSAQDAPSSSPPWTRAPLTADAVIDGIIDLFLHGVEARRRPARRSDHALAVRLALLASLVAAASPLAAQAPAPRPAELSLARAVQLGPAAGGVGLAGPAQRPGGRAHGSAAARRPAAADFRGAGPSRGRRSTSTSSAFPAPSASPPPFTLYALAGAAPAR